MLLASAAIQDPIHSFVPIPKPTNQPRDIKCQTFNRTLALNAKALETNLAQFVNEAVNVDTSATIEAISKGSVASILSMGA
mmetsp:Transcript_27895/g.62093  ORF Transcript_27895/g.62093 Transcript_27895/m.62093 type:complete len:81 (+) Transcript_27895:470-712(+)